MLGPLGGDRLWNPKELDKCKAAAQELVNAQDKGEAEGGIIYGYMSCTSSRKRLSLEALESKEGVGICAGPL